MAKKQMNWTNNAAILKVEHLDIEESQEFDLTEIFEEADNFNEVQLNVIVYGIKQKLADSCARSKDMTLTGAERVEQIAEVWERLKTGDWNQKGVERNTSAKKIKEAQANASPEELAVMKKLGLI